MLQIYSDLHRNLQHSSCRRHHVTSHVGSPLPKRSENTFQATRIRIWLHSVLWRVFLPPGRPLFYWNRLLNKDMVGHSWRSKSRQDRVLNQENFLYHIIYRNQFLWDPNARPRVMHSLLILWHTPVTLSALVLHMVAAYVYGMAVYISGVRVMQSLLILWHTPVTLSALVLHMVAAYVYGTAVYISGVRWTGSMIPLLLGATG